MPNVQSVICNLWVINTDTTDDKCLSDNVFSCYSFSIVFFNILLPSSTTFCHLQYHWILTSCLTWCYGTISKGSQSRTNSQTHKARFSAGCPDQELIYLSFAFNNSRDQTLPKCKHVCSLSWQWSYSGSTWVYIQTRYVYLNLKKWIGMPEIKLCLLLSCLLCLVIQNWTWIL